MGQQQLLLLVLGIVIVGLAVVVGIQAFGENQKKANQDAMVNDGIRIASDAQAWTLKPKAFGGGNNSPANVDFADLGYTVDPSTPKTYPNVNGVYTISDDGASISIVGVNAGNSTHVRIDVFGPSAECVVTEAGTTAPSKAAKPAECTGAWTSSTT